MSVGVGSSPAAASASRISAADWYRAAGSFSSDFMRAAATLPVTRSLKSVGGGNDSSTMARIMVKSPPSRSNGSRPTRAS